MVKYGFPVPPPKITTRPFSKCLMALRRIKGSATSLMFMALCRRVGTSSFSRALCRARPFITVASIPIWSPCTRSIPLLAPARPRKMLPPPITMATCTPLSVICFISWAYSFRRMGSIPYCCSPIRASPESFNRILLYCMAKFYRAKITKNIDAEHGFEKVVGSDGRERKRKECHFFF